MDTLPLLTLVLLATVGALGAVVAALLRCNRRLREANDALQARLREVEALQSRFHEESLRDPLTGLFNRRHLDGTLEQELARARRGGYPLALVMLDLDHFKRINDTYGHAGGDALLRQLGRLLRAACRSGDTACRCGGEEFVLVLPGLDEPVLDERAEFWRCSIEAMVTHFGGKAFSVTASLGVAVFPRHADDALSLLRCADRALYAAKQAGRNRVVLAPKAGDDDARAPAADNRAREAATA
ncbi:GGDEF domain-containing protein [Azohydromonas aeria]|uniref:GGDEF domain-containing protein n=1 Tax=Azohydromonas aeria TaxID=2590212 RepID=UPI0012FAA3DC|nr:GGDEF domain-containing protein [Azohydromonas aeria]